MKYSNGYNKNLHVQKEEFIDALSKATSVLELCKILNKSRPSVYTYAYRFGISLKNKWKFSKLREDGYYSYKDPRNHRKIAEKVLGRPLKRNECVHHIDGDKTNNKNSNLLICTVKYHAELHSKMSFLYQQLMFKT